MSGLFLCPNAQSQRKSIQQEYPFEVGEEVTYQISYNWGFIWVNAGWVTFSIEDTLIQLKRYYHFKGVGATYPKYDWIYKVRDYYHSVADEQLTPFYFERNVSEGKTRIHNEYFFNPSEGYVRTKMQSQDNPVRYDTLETKEGLIDIMSLIYASRLIAFDELAIDQKVPLTFILDGKIYDSYIRYLGKEEKEVKNLGTISCHKFSPLLIEGTIFEEGEDMTVWITADGKHIPVHVETPILVGWIKAILSDYKGLSSPLQFVDK